MKLPLRIFSLGIALSWACYVQANGGATREGIPSTGHPTPSDGATQTDVTIDEETLVIDLHQEFAEVDVRYRMRNTGGGVNQPFFFPVEVWVQDLEDYRVEVDAQAVASTTVGPARPRDPAEMYSLGKENTTKTWKKSEIPFKSGQSREVHIRYRCRYDQRSEDVSDNGSQSEASFAYALSPAATWKGPIGRGQVILNVLHPEPTSVSIQRPKNRFYRVSPTRYEWRFENLKPTLEDNIRIVVHPGYDFFPGGSVRKSGEISGHAMYQIEGSKYFLSHSNYEVTASSTLKGDGKQTYEAGNVREYGSLGTWSEGVEGDGIGESLNITPARVLPLDSILISPGYRKRDQPELWWANGRVAKLEVVLNREHSFTVDIPNERFTGLYPIPIRDYPKPVKSVQLVIRGVHPGTKFQDTCISAVELRAKLAKKPKAHPVR